MLAGALAACGSVTSVHVASDPVAARTPRTLTVYIDLPVRGPTGAQGSASQQQDIVKGARLALAQWGHRVAYGPGGRGGSYHVILRGRNDADPASGTWSQDLTSTNAQTALSDPSTVAYIGDFDSAATALSLQVLSPAGILQISPWSPYIGFTDANPADGKGDPARYYPPNGPDTFARVVPSDLTEATATLEYMRAEGVTRLYVLGDVSVFDAAIAQLVANAAPAAAYGITVVGFISGIDTQTNSQPRGYAQYAASIAAARPDAVFLGATPGVGAMALWRELHTMLPTAKLFAPSTLATPAFLTGIAAAADQCSTAAGAAVACAPVTGATYVTSPILQPAQYPARARAVLRAFRRFYRNLPGSASPSAYALYGYSAMDDVLTAIRLAGRSATNRATLLRVFFHHMGVIRGQPIGTYTIDGNGDSSLARFDGYRVSAAGALVRPQLIVTG